VTELWSILARHLWGAWTPILIVAYLLTRALAARAPRKIERYHLRVVGTLVVFHVIALVVGAALRVGDYETAVADTCALAFELLAAVSLGATLLFRLLLPRIGVVMPRIMIDLLTFVGIVVVMIVVGRNAGFSVTGLITTSAVLTAVIGFSLQDTLGNVMGGLSVQLDKSISIGDWISLGPNMPSGRVTEIRWRYTAIETRAWETVIIPNGQIVKSQITVAGLRGTGSQLVRRQVEFFVDFRTPPTEVIDAVQSALRADPVPRMAKDPPPHVIFQGVRDSFAAYGIRYWLTDPGIDEPTDSSVRVRVWFALRRANIPLSIPARTIFLTEETPDREARKAEQELATRMAALGSVDLFRALPTDTREDIASMLAYTPFASGEAICREGDRDEGLYMIVAGEAVVRIGAGREEREVARLVPGQFFGEMSLMTGEARTASVIAARDMVCYRVDKPAFQKLVQETPAIAERIAEVLAERKQGLTAAHNERDEIRRKRMETAKQDLLGKIRGFFGLSA